eukprot:3557965-Rhodomonas_salina.2
MTLDEPQVADDAVDVDYGDIMGQGTYGEVFGGKLVDSDQRVVWQVCVVCKVCVVCLLACPLLPVAFSFERQQVCKRAKDGVRDSADPVWYGQPRLLAKTLVPAQTRCMWQGIDAQRRFRRHRAGWTIRSCIQYIPRDDLTCASLHTCAGFPLTSAHVWDAAEYLSTESYINDLVMDSHPEVAKRWSGNG